MIERIQELYMQAIEYADSVVPVERRYNDIYYAIASAKHAKLIIQECADLVNEGFGSANFGLGIKGQNLKDHFGVQE